MDSEWIPNGSSLGGRLENSVEANSNRSCDSVQGNGRTERHRVHFKTNEWNPQAIFLISKNSKMEFRATPVEQVQVVSELLIRSLL